MRDDGREVQLFFAGSGQDFRRVGYGGSEQFGRLRIHLEINGYSWISMDIIYGCYPYPWLRQKTVYPDPTKKYMAGPHENN